MVKIKKIILIKTVKTQIERIIQGMIILMRRESEILGRFMTMRITIQRGVIKTKYNLTSMRMFLKEKEEEGTNTNLKITMIRMYRWMVR
jgi:hypothetical protein